jgi:ATP synthase protein I
MPILPPDQLKTLGAISTLGLSFVLAIFIGTAFGWWLDDKLGTSPIFFFIFFFLGLAAGVMNVYRTMSRIK